MNRGQIFKTISGKKPRQNAFDLSHEKKLSGNMADLIPIFVQPVLPNDKVRCQSEMLIRLAPLMAPLMHRVNAYIHYFFVPYRLVWDNWETFITGGVDGKQVPVHPRIGIDNTGKALHTVGSLSDYLGVPPIPEATTVVGEIRVNALPFRAYQLIYNEYYRDQTLTTEVPIDKGDGTSYVVDALTLRKRQWEKDYFSSALPFVQRGDDVMIPTDITYKPDIVGVDGAPVIGQPVTIGTIGSTTTLLEGTTHLQAENIEEIGSTINDLRTAVRLQEWLEKSARAGSRYVEQILAHFGYRVPDYRIQRPEYIGGGKQPIVVSEVLSQFESTETAQGKQTGHAISVGNQASFSYKVPEYGIILGILSVIPRSCYYQGVPRYMMEKLTKFDYAFPEFAHLGEQPVYNGELYVDYGALDSTYRGIFGYQSRYAEEKYVPDSVHGEFRTSLEYWHMGRKFTALPLLNNSFTECNPDTRIFAVQDEAVQKLWIQIYNNVRRITSLPVYGTPML